MQKQKLTTMLMTFLAMAAIIFLLPTQTHALIPYTRSSIWDMMFPPIEDPFKILEHSPLAVPRGDIDDTAAVALARADWKETPTAHEISLDIPGMKREDVKIEVSEENRVLSVSGERKTEEEMKDERWHRAERTVGKFWRQFRLPANADVENVKARLVDGVLRISVPKLGEVEMKKKEPKVISIEEKGSISGEDNVVKATKQEL
ncbi:hypothetical protein BUALT_Bualt15G0098700 [Buddleja alternifolia]|uniref:Uncharacterized protein n=1 Tax=Buddleja alternifolia TaxID=168488 RepID=A0AAV6WLR5_9LAMI|nr:hypothetical protein BUALT_Bualt15G0098700 [Buddleja alternifolia]